MAGCVFLFSVFLLLLVVPGLSSAAIKRERLTTSEEDAVALLRRDSTSPPPPPPAGPTEYFQVTRPIPLPNDKPCSVLLLQHDFAYTYGKPPVTTAYTPPSHCRRRGTPSKVVLEWRAACRGRQFDRIFGIWLGGVELLRSCTAEPRATGIVWTVEKDVTRYTSLFFSENQTLAVFLGNIVDQTYTGIYHANISLHFYYGGKDLPIDGQWFLVQSPADSPAKEVTIPRNAFRAVIEVFVSFHADDEFWYGNLPDDYISSNNLTGTPGKGPFREVVVTVDGAVAGVPLLWRPITGIGSFDLPSYDIEITPFLGKLLDGKPHRLGFAVTNALSSWFIDGNLHIWLDSKSSQTIGGLIKHESPELKLYALSDFKGLDGNFSTTGDRRISSTGWVISSHGKITTHFFQVLDYKNFMEMKDNGSTQVINQTIDSTSGVYVKSPGSVLFSDEIFRSFPLHLYSGTKRFTGERFGFSFGALLNSQKADGVMIVKGNLVVSGVGSTQQDYRYEGTDGCYSRNVSSSNYTILFDESEKVCGRRSLFELGSSLNRWIPYPARRASLSVAMPKLKKIDD
ncbi:unnamed protein product [Spirodela intermedia]|uniref:Peptide N-acetyl-beta-D-glucosaminyl asparaginase amidase A N-terminal domain-containing protein n=1 Tax=Spirodela intermedia TaxID=51605 RepID=A0A7I8IUC9_SPIIN|nr:unnamed protein product [Spirodela intermedia]CAA6661150.1 unnamed protein product [Spirodela intermedia]